MPCMKMKPSVVKIFQLTTPIYNITLRMRPNLMPGCPLGVRGLVLPLRHEQQKDHHLSNFLLHAAGNSVSGLYL